MSPPNNTQGTHMNDELNLNELDTVSGGGIVEWAHNVVDQALKAASNVINCDKNPGLIVCGK